MQRKPARIQRYCLVLLRRRLWLLHGVSVAAYLLREPALTASIRPDTPSEMASFGFARNAE